MNDSISKTCLVCNSSDIVDAIQLNDHLVSQEPFQISECHSCGFRFIANPPAEIHAGPYYETEEYVEHSDSSDGFINFFYHKARRWMLKYKLSMLEKLDRKKKLLDFGTGTGYFLNFMKSKGYDVKGIEISEKARSFGQKSFELDISHPSTIHDSDFPTKFGYITFWHVLEHVYNPDKLIPRLHEILDDKGVLVVALPNYKCLEASVYKEYWNGYDVPRHLWHWNRSSFELYMKKFGFKTVKTKLLPLDPFYNCLISESYRKKNWAHILIPFIGSASLFKGWMNKDKASSIVYFLEKE